ncbi:hypothetical protein GJ496_009209 [Pomphorhynchus laevis]|nr:hypothetical protein GJ496_009209 [Pomphorhynchus laevis]
MDTRRKQNEYVRCCSEIDNFKCTKTVIQDHCYNNDPQVDSELNALSCFDDIESDIEKLRLVACQLEHQCKTAYKNRLNGRSLSDDNIYNLSSSGEYSLNIPKGYISILRVSELINNSISRLRLLSPDSTVYKLISTMHRYMLETLNSIKLQSDSEIVQKLENYFKLDSFDENVDTRDVKGLERAIYEIKLLFSRPLDRKSASYDYSVSNSHDATSGNQLVLERTQTVQSQASSIAKSNLVTESGYIRQMQSEKSRSSINEVCLQNIKSSEIAITLKDGHNSSCDRQIVPIENDFILSKTKLDGVSDIIESDIRLARSYGSNTYTDSLEHSESVQNTAAISSPVKYKFTNNVFSKRWKSKPYCQIREPTPSSDDEELEDEFVFNEFEQGQNQIILFDQHACDERIRLENFENEIIQMCSIFESKQVLDHIAQSIDNFEQASIYETLQKERHSNPYIAIYRLPTIQKYLKSKACHGNADPNYQYAYYGLTLHQSTFVK